MKFCINSTARPTEVPPLAHKGVWDSWSYLDQATTSKGKPGNNTIIRQSSKDLVLGQKTYRMWQASDQNCLNSLYIASSARQVFPLISPRHPVPQHTTSLLEEKGEMSKKKWEWLPPGSCFNLDPPLAQINNVPVEFNLSLVKRDNDRRSSETGRCPVRHLF